MARRILQGLLAIGILAFLLTLDPPRPRPATAFSNMPPLRKTGALLQGQGTCNDCQSAAGDNAGNGSLVITAPDTYTPGQTYTITVTEQDPGQSRWGFELTVIKGDLTMGGSLTNTTTLTGTGANSGITYIGQIDGVGGDGTFAGTANGPVSWSFNWTAPATGSGPVRFYAAGVAADNSGSADDPDFTYTTAKQVEEEIPTAVMSVTWGFIKKTYR